MKNKENKKRDKRNIFNLIGLTSIAGINFKKAAELHILLKINDIEDLYKACKENKLAALPGWGTNSQAKVKSQIEINILWMMGQCNKVKKEVDSPHQNPLVDKEILMEMARNFNPEHL
jgi:DNA polymerase/3'-5' exonuclease PolX